MELGSSTLATKEIRIEISYYKQIKDGFLHHARVKIGKENFIVQQLEINVPIHAEYGCGCGSQFNHEPAFYLAGDCEYFKHDARKRSMKIY